jgi:hypothetical protein
MLDLYNNKYDITTLEKNIYAIGLWEILFTQKINAKFAAKYILNKSYQLTKEEEMITIDSVLYFQKHISLLDLIQELNVCKKDDFLFDNGNSE